MLKRLITRSFSTSQSYKKANDLLNPNRYMKTLHNIYNEIDLNIINEKHISNPNSPEFAIEYLKALNRAKKYDDAELNGQRILNNYKNLSSSETSQVKQMIVYSQRKRGQYVNTSTRLMYLGILAAVWLYFAKTNGQSALQSYIGQGMMTDLPVKPVKVQKNIKFKDVIGIDEYKEEVMEIVDYLNDPQKFETLGAEIPRGILLIGKPGTGKTLLAKALANETGCSFFYKSASEFDQIFVGAGAKNIRELFKAAREHSPSIIFIDEIDSIGSDRESSAFESIPNDTLNQLLAEMDGFKKNERVIVMGATNLPEVLDKALKRPGRFDKKINIPLPDKNGRKKLLKHYLSRVSHKNDIDLERYAGITTNFTGAQIKQLVNEAVCIAVLDKRSEAWNKDMEKAFDRELMGIRKQKINMDKERKTRSAVYESGIAVASFLVKDAQPLYKVSILPIGDKVKGAVLKTDKDLLNNNKTQIKAMAKLALAGRAAEQVFYNGRVSSRCVDDMKRASRICMAFARKLAMMEDVSLISAEKKDLSEDYNRVLELKASEMMNDIYKEVLELIDDNKNTVNRVAKELVKKETLTKEQVKKLVK